MGLYKISGRVSEKCTIRIIQDDEYKAEKDVLPGPYEILFISHSGSSILAVAENEQGLTIKFPNIEAVEVLESR